MNGLLKLGRWALLASVPLLGFAAESKKEGGATEVVPPPMPGIKSLHIEPSSLTLKHGRDERRVLVLGKTDSGKLIDLTSTAVLKPETPAVEVGAEKYIHAKSKGEGGSRV